MSALAFSTHRYHASFFTTLLPFITIVVVACSVYTVRHDYLPAVPCLPGIDRFPPSAPLPGWVSLGLLCSSLPSSATSGLHLMTSGSLRLPDLDFRFPTTSGSLLPVSVDFRFSNTGFRRLPVRNTSLRGHLPALNNGTPSACALCIHGVLSDTQSQVQGEDGGFGAVCGFCMLQPTWVMTNEW